MILIILVDPSLVIITLYLISDSCTSVDKKRRRNIAFSPYGHAPAQESLPPGSWNLHFCRPFLGYHYSTLNLSDLCQGVEKKILKKEIMHFHYISYMAMPSTRTHESGVMKFTILVDPSLDIIGLSEPCPSLEKKIFEEIYQLYTFYPQNYLPLG